VCILCGVFRVDVLCTCALYTLIAGWCNRNTYKTTLIHNADNVNCFNKLQIYNYVHNTRWMQLQSAHLICRTEHLTWCCMWGQHCKVAGTSWVEQLATMTDMQLCPKLNAEVTGPFYYKCLSLNILLIVQCSVFAPFWTILLSQLIHIPPGSYSISTTVYTCVSKSTFTIDSHSSRVI
jgi:hypothetical protein